MRTPPDGVVTGVAAPLILWAATDLSFLRAVAISGFVLLPWALMDGWRRYRVHKARTVPGPDYSARITIPPEVLACTRAPTTHEQIELIRRLREIQEQLIQLQRGQ